MRKVISDCSVISFRTVDTYLQETDIKSQGVTQNNKECIWKINIFDGVHFHSQ
jgi:hypothetical protein